jgi:hypothetical protein
VGVAEVFEVGRLLNFAKAIEANLCGYTARPGGILCREKLLRQMELSAELDAVMLPTGVRLRVPAAEADAADWFCGRSWAGCGRLCG